MSYKTQRIPSYTDRILYKSADRLGDNLLPLAYEHCPNFITSDHKPIRGAFQIVPNRLDGRMACEEEVRLTFKRMSCTGLPIADAVGSSDPYLMFLWDSVDLVPQKTNFMDYLRGLFVEHAWPRTNYIPNTLNPEWKGKQVTLRWKKGDIGSDAMLFIIAMDHDTVGRDDLLGVLALNVKDLVRLKKGKKFKKLKFSRQLLRNGKPAGSIKFKLEVAAESPGRRFGFAELGAGIFGSSQANLQSQTITASSDDDDDEDFYDNWNDSDDDDRKVSFRI